MFQNWNQITLKNNLVKIRELKRGDYPWLMEAAFDPLIWAQHPNTNLYQPHEFDKMFNQVRNNECGFTIIDVKTNERIGMISVRDYNRYAISCEIGNSFLIRRCWGGEYNKAVKSLLYTYLFNKIDYIEVYIHRDNIRSQKANIKLGFRQIEDDCCSNSNMLRYVLHKKDWSK